MDLYNSFRCSKTKPFKKDYSNVNYFQWFKSFWCFLKLIIIILMRQEFNFFFRGGKTIFWWYYDITGITFIWNVFKKYTKFVCISHRMNITWIKQSFIGLHLHFLKSCKYNFFFTILNKLNFFSFIIFYN